MYEFTRKERSRAGWSPSGFVLKSQRSGTGPDAPGQKHLSSWIIQRITGDWYSLADMSSDLGQPLPLQAVVEIEPDYQTSQLSSSRKIVSLPMNWLQVKLNQLGNEES